MVSTPPPQHQGARRALLLGSFGALSAAALGCERPSPETPHGLPRPGSGARIEGEHRELALAPRGESAPRGSEFVDKALGLRPAEREREIVREIEAGNVPPFERALIPIDVAHGSLRGRVWVMPDYLAIGSDDDWVRVPMTVRSAKAIARNVGAVLPTKKLVDEIHAAAKVRISSPYMAPGRDMTSVEYFVAHHAAIEQRRQATHAHLGELVSGPKKDLVISKRALSEPRRTAIYGWFTDDGGAIQALSLVHDDRYVDYAHGIRLVLADMAVDGRSVPVLDVLADHELAPLISDEGSFDLRKVWEKGW